MEWWEYILLALGVSGFFLGVYNTFIKDRPRLKITKIDCYFCNEAYFLAGDEIPVIHINLRVNNISNKNNSIVSICLAESDYIKISKENKYKIEPGNYIEIKESFGSASAPLPRNAIIETEIILEDNYGVKYTEEIKAKFIPF